MELEQIPEKRPARFASNQGQLTRNLSFADRPLNRTYNRYAFLILGLGLSLILWALSSATGANPSQASVSNNTSNQTAIPDSTHHTAAMHGYIDPQTGRPTAPPQDQATPEESDSPSRSYFQASSTATTQLNSTIEGGGKLIILGPSVRGSMKASLKNKRAFAQCDITQEQSH